MQVKICGITNLEDARLCESLGVGFLGFIFEACSPRAIDYAAAKSIIARLTTARAVGVFVNQDIDEICTHARKLDLTAVQIYQNHIFNNPPFQVIRVMRVKDARDLIAMDNLRQKFPQDYFLLDTYHENKFGGTGEPFDWTLLPHNLDRCFLSGGITPENVLAAKEYRPFAIDLASGVEACPGKKDPVKLKKLIDNIRGPVMGYLHPCHPSKNTNTLKCVKEK